MDQWMSENLSWLLDFVPLYATLLLIVDNPIYPPLISIHTQFLQSQVTDRLTLAIGYLQLMDNLIVE